MQGFSSPVLTRLAAACAFAMVAACSDGVGPADPLPPAPIDVTPPGPLDLAVGDTLTLQAVARNGPAGIVFASSEPGVVAVTRQGFIRALASGEVQITATSEADPRSVASITVRVSSRGSIVIESLVDAMNLPVEPKQVAGTVVARVRVQSGDAVRLEALLDETVACIHTFGDTATAPPVTSGAIRRNLTAGVVDCPLNTAAFDSITGEPHFLNGPVMLTARLVRGDGSVLASTSHPTLTLANRDAVVATLVPEREGTDEMGRRWGGGGLEITALPVLYTPALKVEQVNFLYVGPEVSIYFYVDSVAPFRLSLSERLADVVDESLYFTVTAVTNEESKRPESRTPLLRYDGSAPTPGTLRIRDWVGADTEFASLYLPSAEADRGVGRVGVRFFGGDPNLSAAQVVERDSAVQRGSDLRQAPYGAYRLVYEVCDAVRNCSARSGFLFGVDNTPPTIEATNLADRAIDPDGDLTLVIADGLSGFDASPLAVSVEALVSNVGQPLCGPVIEGRKLPGQVGAGGCVAAATDTTIPVPRTTPGYYTYTIRAVDRAGNRSPELKRSFLVDRVPPVLTAFTIPNQLVPGDSATFTGEVVDNLDLAEVDFRLVFPTPTGGRIALAFAPPVRAGTPFSGRLTQSFSASSRFPFVRTLTYTASSPRTTVLVDSVQIRAVDAAELTTRASQRVSPSVFGGNASIADPFTAVSSATLLVGAQRVCTFRCLATDPAGLTVTLRVVGAPGLSPLARMHLFARDPDGTIHSAGSTATFAVAGTGTQLTYTYTLSYTPPARATGSYVLFGVGVGGAGNALMSDSQVIELFTR